MIEKREVIVELKPWEYEWASHVGIRRFIENWDSKNAPYYEDENKMQDDRSAQVAACVAEMAVAKHINRFWSGTVWSKQQHHLYKNLPDVGENIEVRRIRTQKVASLREHQVGMNLTLWVAEPLEPEYRVVKVHGYINHDKAWKLSSETKYAGTRSIPLNFLSHNFCCKSDTPEPELLEST